MSAAATVYPADVAPVIDAHAPPEASHRRHWYAYAVGLFVHDPGDDVNTCPCPTNPDTVGSDVFTGTDPPDADTTAVCADVAGAPAPEALDAVTMTRTV
jgi:hypothetical protein